jgi:YegS/Rv2252/BmrU family lipid kinase
MSGPGHAFRARRRVRVLFNPTAGGGKRTPREGGIADAVARLRARRLEAVRRRLTELGLDVRVSATESAEHAAELALATAQAEEEVVAYGGDGMVRIAAAALQGTDAVLGILPGGRGNDFAASLEIPRDALKACDVVAHGVERRVDAGEVNGVLFVGIASIGLESEVTPIVNAAPRVGGRAIYLAATLYGLARWRPAGFELDLDGEHLTFTGYLAAVANSGRFGGGMRLAPDARLDDGLLDVVTIGHISRTHFVRATPKVFRGTHGNEPNVYMSQANAVRLDADRPFAVYADGDELAWTPALVRALPAALKVRVPE